MEFLRWLIIVVLLILLAFVLVQLFVPFKPTQEELDRRYGKSKR